MADVFGTLRALLNRPSQQAFDEILAIFADADEGQRARWLPYARDYFARQWDGPARVYNRTITQHTLLDRLEHQRPSTEFVLGIYMRGTELSPADVYQVEFLPEFGNLEVIEAIGSTFDDSCLQVLGRAEHLSNIRGLVLRAHRFSADGLYHIVHADHLAGLEVLDLSECRIDVASARLIAESEQMASLRELYVDENVIAPEGLEALATSPHLASHITEHFAQAHAMFVT